MFFHILHLSQSRHAVATQVAAHVLSQVSGCILQGGHGATAVKCGGTGALQRVRVIHLSRDTLFWFDVHAGRPGVLNTKGAADSRMAQPVMSKHEAPQRALEYSGIQGQASKQEQASEQVDGASVDDDEQALLQRVKAWSTVHHPVALNAGLLS